VANAHGLLSAALGVYLPDLKLKTRLPAKRKPDLYVPTDEDVQRVLAHVAGRELEIAVLLAAFGPMRREEICALTSADVSGCAVKVSKAMVKDGETRQWVVRDVPKSYEGYRTIIFPQEVADKLAAIEGRVFKANPDALTSRFRRAIRFSRSPHFRFHDLRHYSASMMHALGIPDKYIMERGGWASDQVLKQIYRNSISDQRERFNNVANAHFSALISEASAHAMAHGKKKSLE
jgi:integrase